MALPTLIVITNNDGQNAYLTHAFTTLSKKYTLLFYAADTVTSPFVRAKQIIADIKKNSYRVDGIFGFLDNDVSIAAIIAEELQLPGPTLKAIYTAQNKELFSKLLRSHKLPYPQTTTINILQKRLPRFQYPVFIRPVKGSFSADSYMIDSEVELKKVMHQLAQKKEIVAPAYKVLFQYFNTAYTDLDHLFIVQEFINAKQYNADGFVHNGKVFLLGITESIYTPDRKSFKRFDFPTRLPNRTFKKLTGIIQKLVTVLEFNTSGFNLEFFITADKKIIIIEFNTRLSRQFFPLFEEMFRETPLEMLCEVALSHSPTIEKREGKMKISSIPLRLFHNAKVLSVPPQSELAKLEETLGIISINIYVQEGKKLSDYRQDAYSYRYGVVDIKGKNLREVIMKEKNLMKKLAIKFKKIR